MQRYVGVLRTFETDVYFQKIICKNDIGKTAPKFLLLLFKCCFLPEVGEHHKMFLTRSPAALNIAYHKCVTQAHICICVRKLVPNVLNHHIFVSIIIIHNEWGWWRSSSAIECFKSQRSKKHYHCARCPVDNSQGPVISPAPFPYKSETQ